MNRFGKDPLDASAVNARQPVRIALGMYLPHIAERLTRSLEQHVDTGKVNLLEYLRD